MLKYTKILNVISIINKIIDFIWVKYLIIIKDSYEFNEVQIK